MNLLKRLVASVSKLTGDISVLGGLLQRISKSLQDGTHGALVNGAYRAQAGGEMMQRGGHRRVLLAPRTHRPGYRLLGSVYR